MARIRIRQTNRWKGSLFRDKPHVCRDIEVVIKRFGKLTDVGLYEGQVVPYLDLEQNDIPALMDVLPEEVLLHPMTGAMYQKWGIGRGVNGLGQHLEGWDIYLTEGEDNPLWDWPHFYGGVLFTMHLITECGAHIHIAVQQMRSFLEVDRGAGLPPMNLWDFAIEYSLAMDYTVSIRKYGFLRSYFNTGWFHKLNTKLKLATPTIDHPEHVGRPTKKQSGRDLMLNLKPERFIFPDRYFCYVRPMVSLLMFGLSKGCTRLHEFDTRYADYLYPFRDQNTPETSRQRMIGQVPWNRVLIHCDREYWRFLFMLESIIPNLDCRLGHPAFVRAMYTIPVLIPRGDCTEKTRLFRGLSLDINKLIWRTPGMSMALIQAMNALKGELAKVGGLGHVRRLHLDRHKKQKLPRNHSFILMDHSGPWNFVTSYKHETHYLPRTYSVALYELFALAGPNAFTELDLGKEVFEEDAAEKCNRDFVWMPSANSALI